MEQSTMNDQTNDDTTENDAPSYLGTATYSPDDNKLRFYPRHRLDKADYDRIKAAGFSWAPKQELFVAGMWTPGREDLLIEWCGEIDDEDTSLVDRAEERAERFSEYREKRASDAERAHKTVAGIVEHIPLGQPILIGHHSERHARKDAERIRSGMAKAVKMWETSTYWKSRAAGALAHAKYKESFQVRARRIKKIEADQRKAQADYDSAGTRLEAWTRPGLTREFALILANSSYSSFKFPLDKYPRGPEVSQYEGDMGLWSAMDHGIIDHEQARDLIAPRLRYTQAQRLRWLTHYANRLEYERAMLQEQGGLITDKFAIVPGGQVLCGSSWLTVVRVNRSNGKIVSVTTNGKYGRVRGIEEVSDYRAPEAGDVARVKEATKLPPLCNYDGEGFRRCTKVEFDRAKRCGSAYTRCMEGNETTGAHRARVGMSSSYSRVQYFITDIPVKPAPAPSAPKIRPSELPQESIAPAFAPREPREVDPRDDLFSGLKQALKTGVQVVAAPQLFPTPAALAVQMVEYAGIEAGHSVLEPSAGTGNLIRALPVLRPGGYVVAVEINPALANKLGDIADEVHNVDFLTVTLESELLGTFDRIVMNPPFINGSDIKHIQHARQFLKPGGKLVAICANGPRQREQLMSIATHWEDLPAGSFADQGTGVNTAMLVIDN